MTHKEYKEILNYELQRATQRGSFSFFQRIRYKYFTPNTNCIFLARRMWYLFSLGGIKRILSRFIYRKIFKKYGCCIYPNAKVGRGFCIAHPVGIVLGKCEVGENFVIFQNATIGVKKWRCTDNRKQRETLY